MLDYRMEHAFSYRATLGEPEVIGEVPGGIRVNFYATGGEVTGPGLTGEIVPVGGDWMTIRHDGSVLLDVRATFRSHDGALIEIFYNGLADLGENGYRDFLEGRLPAELQIRAAPRLRTAHPDYAWMNRLQFVNIGAVDFASGSVSYDTYALR